MSSDESKDPPKFDDETAVTVAPFVEVELVYDRGHAGMETSDWRAFEVWTRNRIYSVDWSMRCIEVIDRDTDMRQLEHPFLGAHLAGGQSQADGSMEMTFPCPRPGTEAVFEHRSGPRTGFTNTSTVVRVVLRLRVLSVPIEKASDTWGAISESYQFGDVAKPEVK